MKARKTIAGLLMAAMLVLPMGTVLGQYDPVIGEGTVSVSSMPYYWYEQGGFDYENGVLSGTYLDLILDESAGTIEDYTLRFAFHDTVYPTFMYQDSTYGAEDGNMYNYEFGPTYDPTFENITIFDSMTVENFVPNGQPGIFGERFLFQGQNILFECYDYEGAWSSYMIDEGNTSFTFEVASGFNVSKFHDWYEMEWEEWEEDWDADIDYIVTQEENLEEWEKDMVMPGMVEEPWFIDYYWDEVWIEGFNTSTSIYIDNGTATIDGNTITIELGSNGRIDIGSWVEMPYFDYYMDPWTEDWDYEDRGLIEMDPWTEDWDYEDRGLIEAAIEEGVVAAVGYLFAEEGEMQWSDANYYEDPTFSMEFKDVNDQYIEIEVDSAIPTGRIVSVNMNDAALDVSDIDELLVKLDGAEIEAYDTLEDLTEIVGGQEAGYYVLIGDNGNTVFVYVPHFSVHTITLESIAGVANILLPAVLATALISVLAVAVVKRSRKGQDEY